MGKGCSHQTVLLGWSHNAIYMYTHGVPQLEIVDYHNYYGGSFSEKNA